MNDEIFAAALDGLSEMIYAGTVGSPETEAVFDSEPLVNAVEIELKRRTACDLPDRFVALLRHGDHSCPSWFVGFRVFLCEQVKSNARFAAILNAVTLEVILRESKGRSAGA